MTRIAVAGTDADIARCHAVLAELRPHVSSEDVVERVRRQEKRGGYRLAFLEEDGNVTTVAGFRIFECLAWGKVLYVDDLVSGSAFRSQGHGGRLLEWLKARAMEERCDELHLDSGVQRFGAHRFYLREGFDITSHHFAVKIHRSQGE